VDDHEFLPEAYEERFGISKAEYEQRVLALTRVELERAIHPDAPESYADCGLDFRGSVIAVKLVGHGLDTELVVLFHLGESLDVFGDRHRIWPAPDPRHQMGTLESTANLIAVDVVETVQSTPPTALMQYRDEDGIAWICYPASDAT
jgi:hypothetical protein